MVAMIHKYNDELVSNIVIINNEEKDVYSNTDESCNSLLLLTMLTISEIIALKLCVSAGY